MSLYEPFDTTYGDADATSESNSTTAANPSKEELESYIKTLNLSFDTIKIVILAVLLNLYYVYLTRQQTLDALNDTNCTDNSVEPKKILDFANLLLIYCTATFLYINYNQYNKLNSVPESEKDSTALNKARKSFLASVLVFIATLISRSNIDT